MEKQEYSVIEFIQYLKDKPYIKLYKAARLAEISMLISEFIQKLQDLCDNEGDMEIVIVTVNNGLGSVPHVKKSRFYDQFEITK